MERISGRHTVKPVPSVTLEPVPSVTLEGHTRSVSSCRFSPDGARVVSGSLDKTLRLWDAATSACLRTLKGHTSCVSSCGFSPDGARVVSGSLDKTLRLWDAATGACLRTLKMHTRFVSSWGFSPDGARVVSGSGDKTLRLLDAATGECICTLKGHTSLVSSCGFSPDGARVVSGSDDNKLRLWTLPKDLAPIVLFALSRAVAPHTLGDACTPTALKDALEKHRDVLLTPGGALRDPALLGQCIKKAAGEPARVLDLDEVWRGLASGDAELQIRDQQVAHAQNMVTPVEIETLETLFGKTAAGGRRPNSKFVGQQMVLRNLEKSLKVQAVAGSGAQIMLFDGPPGLGKTQATTNGR